MTFKIRKKKIKNIRQTLWAIISLMAGQIQLKFGKGGAHPKEFSMAKIVRLPTHFIFPVKYTLVCPGCTWPHDT